MDNTPFPEWLSCKTQKKSTFHLLARYGLQTQPRYLKIFILESFAINALPPCPVSFCEITSLNDKARDNSVYVRTLETWTIMSQKASHQTRILQSPQLGLYQNRIQRCTGRGSFQLFWVQCLPAARKWFYQPVVLCVGSTEFDWDIKRLTEYPGEHYHWQPHRWIHKGCLGRSVPTLAVHFTPTITRV